MIWVEKSPEGEGALYAGAGQNMPVMPPLDFWAPMGANADARSSRAGGGGTKPGEGGVVVGVAAAPVVPAPGM